MKKRLSTLILSLALCLTSLNAWAQSVPAEAVSQALAQALAKEAASASDPWAKFLLSQPVEDLRVEEGSAAFSLPAWDPGVEKLEGEAEDWLLAIWQSVHLSKVEGRVTYESAGEDGVKLTGGLKDFVAQAKAAASYAKGQFDLTPVRRAIVARLLPTDLYDESGAPTPAFAALIKVYEGTLSQARLEAALSAQKSASLGVSAGPEALRLVFYSAPGNKLGQAAAEEALAELAATDLANQMSREEIALHYAHAYARQGASFRQGGAKGEKRVLTLDLRKMMTQSIYQQDFVDYVSAMTSEFEAQLTLLEEAARSMPDYPLREQPASGVITAAAGEGEGTLIILRAEEDGLGRYLALRDGAGRTVLTAFLRSGESCQAYVPQGEYTILCAKGKDWYGPVRMFEQQGEYVSSRDKVAVLDDTHYHTITLGGESALPVRQAQMAEFTDGATQDAAVTANG